MVEEHGGRVHQARQEQGLQGERSESAAPFPPQAHPLSVQNIGGVFVVLLCGLALAIMVSNITVLVIMALKDFVSHFICPF